MKNTREKLALLAGGVIIGLLVVIWTIAGSEKLFLRTVPIEQRLVSQNEAIRKKAQQELLGLGADAKHDVAGRLVPALTQGNPFLRKWAAISLALIGPSAQEALPALLQCVTLPEKEIAQACRVALSEIGTPDVGQLPNLMRALEDGRPEVRCEAVASIAKMGPAADEAVPTILTQIEEGATISECLAHAAAELSQPGSTMLLGLQKMLSSPKESTRRNAATVFVLVGPRTQEQIQVLLKTLAEDTSGEVRRPVSRALALKQTPERGQLSSLGFAIRRSRSEVVRLTALELLQSQGLPLEQVDVFILQGLQDSAPAVRLQAARWLKTLDLKARFALSNLIPLLKDADPTVRRTALETLRQSVGKRKDFLPPIAKAQRDEDPGIRCMAAQTLVEMGASDRVAIPILAADVKNSALIDGNCPADALGMAGHFNPDVVPTLAKLLGEKDRETRRRAVHALLQLGAKAKEALPALAQAQKDQVPGADNALNAIRDAVARTRRKR